MLPGSRKLHSILQPKKRFLLNHLDCYGDRVVDLELCYEEHVPFADILLGNVGTDTIDNGPWKESLNGVQPKVSLGEND